MMKQKAVMPALVMLVIMTAYIAGYAFGSPHTDTADELLRAYEIRRGIAFPLQGPPLGQVLHLGPLWFYLVAIPLLLKNSWLFASLFIGFVCSLKFPLAYWCGSRLLDARFGLLWATSLFVPTWTTFQALVFLNPNAVEAALLLVLAVYIHGWRQPTLPAFAAFGLSLAVAAHVHPTTAPAGLLLLPLLWRHWSARGNSSAAIALFGIAFALPFLPYLFIQSLSGFPDLRGAREYVEGQIHLAGALNAPRIIWNWLVQGPAIEFEYFVGWSRAAATAVGTASALIYFGLAIVTAIASRGRPRTILIGTVAWLLVLAGWCGAMRTTTPLQFTWVLGPAFAAILALGVWVCSSIRRIGFAAGSCLALAMLANVFVLSMMARRVEEGEGRLPSRIMDIQGRLPSAEYRDVWFPAFAHARLGTLLCDAPKPISLHGHLAFIEDKDLGLDMLFACGKRTGVKLGGSSDTPYVGMSRAYWAALGAQPRCWIGSLGLARDIAVPLHGPSMPMATGDTYLPRRPSGRHPERISVSFEASGGEAVLVTNMLGGYEAFRVIAATVDEKPALSVAQNDMSALLVSSSKGEPLQTWVVEIETSNPAGIDIVAIQLEQNGSRPKACHD